MHIASMVVVPDRNLNRLESIHKSFIWAAKKPKINHSSLISHYIEGGQKDEDISAKIIALQLVWVLLLFEENFHPRKLIPLNSLISTGIKSLFHSNLDLAVVFPIIQHIGQSSQDTSHAVRLKSCLNIYGLTDA